jgi:hypothetical protein
VVRGEVFPAKNLDAAFQGEEVEGVGDAEVEEVFHGEVVQKQAVDPGWGWISGLRNGE